MVHGGRVASVEVGSKSRNFLLRSRGVQTLLLRGKGNVTDDNGGAKLGMLKAELARTAVRVWVPGKWQVKEVAYASIPNGRPIPPTGR